MIFRFIAKVFYIILVIIETLISVRFVFRLIDANAQNAIVKTIYALSSIFVDPFRGIVSGDWHLGRFYLDVTALIALVVYMFMAFVVIEVVKLFSPRQ